MMSFLDNSKIWNIFLEQETFFSWSSKTYYSDLWFKTEYEARVKRREILKSNLIDAKKKLLARENICPVQRTIFRKQYLRLKDMQKTNEKRILVLRRFKQS